MSGQYNLLIAAAVFSNPYKEPSQFMQNVMVMKEKSDMTSAEKFPPNNYLQLPIWSEILKSCG